MGYNLFLSEINFVYPFFYTQVATCNGNLMLAQASTLVLPIIKQCEKIVLLLMCMARLAIALGIRPLTWAFR